MSSAFHGIDLSSRALRAFTKALDVTGHNIANASTPGYSRQTIDLQPAIGDTSGSFRTFNVGNGVDIASVNRIRDVFLEGRKLTATSQFGRYQQLSTSLGRVESVVLEPGANGIANALSQFFDAWSGLSSNPSNTGARVEVQMAGQTLATRIRTGNADLREVQKDLDLTISQTISEIQSTMQRVADLNTEIKHQKAMGGNLSDLEDQRDMAITDLAGLIDIKTFKFEDGTINVYLGSTTLVDTTGAYSFPTTFSSATATVGTQGVSSGRLRGLFDAQNKVTSQLTQLDNLANTLRSSVNGIHETGVNPAGATGIKFFNDVAPPTPQSGAIDFDLDPAILADANAIAAGSNGAAGDGSIALALSNLREATQGTLGTRTFEDYYANAVAGLGRDASLANSTLDTSDKLLTQTQSQIESVSGVSIDDEMANLLRFQRSYQAAARALSIFDQVTEDLIGLLRR